MTISRKVALVSTKLSGTRQRNVPYNAVSLNVLREIFPTVEGMRDGQVDGIASAPKRDNVAKTEEDDTDRVRPLRTLRPVAERQDVTHDEQTKIEVLQDDVDDVNAVAEVE